MTRQIKTPAWFSQAVARPVPPTLTWDDIKQEAEKKLLSMSASDIAALLGPNLPQVMKVDKRGHRGIPGRWASFGTSGTTDLDFNADHIYDPQELAQKEIDKNNKRFIRKVIES